MIPDPKNGGQYWGASLNSFLLAVGHSPALVQKILREHHLDRIDPERWYDAAAVIPIYYAIEQQIGRSAVIAVGKRMIEAANFPPGLEDVRTLLMSLDIAYKLNCRGPDSGGITCELEDDNSAVLEFTGTWGPCALQIGIIEGSCARLGVQPLVEHGATGCMDRGGKSCTYRVSW